MNSIKLKKFLSDNKTIIVCGKRKMVNDFIYMFDDKLQNYLKAVTEDGDILSLSTVISSINREAGVAFILCLDEYKWAEQYLEGLGYIYQKDILVINDFYEILDEDFLASRGGRIGTNQDKELVLWGAGAAGKHFLKYAENHDKVRFLIDTDKNKDGSLISGVPVITPDKIMNWNSLYVYITCWQKQEVYDFLVKKGLQEDVDFSSYNYCGSSDPRPSEMFEKTLHDVPVDVCCKTPFEFAFTQETGNIWMCCYAPGVFYGNILNEPFQKLWYSVKAKILRLSMVNQTYSFCNYYTCPYIKKEDWEKKPIQHVPEENYLEQCIQMPKTVSISHDSSCNLWCESCRHDRFIASGESEKKAYLISDKLIKEVLPDCENIILAGNGEVFVSKAYKKIIETKFKSNCQKVTLNIFTNGILFNESSWSNLWELHRDKDLALIVSVDAATEETYRLLRRGGDFNKLLSNLKFAGKLKDEKLLKSIIMDFVVQKKNVEEAVMFVKLAKKLNADAVMFSALANWGTYSETEYKELTVLDENGILKHEYENIFSDPIFSDPMVDLGNIRCALKGVDM